tara:strand:+ start:382031 stop:383593 length:1563 start_codon:yes stop_codon:yes gene_type:complete
MSRLGSPTAFNPDSGQSTGLGVNKKKKKRLGVEPVESAQPAGSRPRFNQLRQSQLAGQGVNVKELKQTNDTNRQRIRDSETSRVEGGQQVRRLRASGDIEGANALRASLREQRVGETELRREVAGRSSLLRGSIADLPPEQQFAERQRGRDHLNAQLPGIAGAAATAASTAEDAQQQRLADIGARIFEIQSPGRSADGLNRFELARLAEGADPEVLARATNGVGLPTDRTGGLRDFAGRTNELAQTGVDFGPNEVRQRRLDPDLIEQVRAEQETQSIRDAAIGQIERDQIEQQTLASTNETGRLNRDASVIEQERTLAELGAAGNAASQEIVPDRGRLEQAQIEQAIKEAEFGGASATAATQNIGLANTGVESLSPEERIEYELKAADTLNALRGSVRGEEADAQLQSTLEAVRTAGLSLNPKAAAKYAKDMLAKLEASKADSRPLEDGGFRNSLRSTVIQGISDYTTLNNPLSPYSIYDVGKRIATGATQTENERARGNTTDTLYSQIISELRALAAGA